MRLEVETTGILLGISWPWPLGKLEKAAKDNPTDYLIYGACRCDRTLFVTAKEGLRRNMGGGL